MATSQVQQDAVGMIFRLTIVDQLGAVVDLSDATVMKFVFQKPDGTFLEGDAQHTTNGTNGQMEYITLDGDLSVSGMWKYQGYIEVGGAEYYTTIGKFKVAKNLK